MSRVFIVGLPKLVRNRVESTLTAAGYFAKSIQADRLIKRGILKLLPDPSHATEMLRAYCDSLEHYDQAKIYVLPFTQIPPELYQELDCLVEMGAKVIKFKMGEDGCPILDQINPTLDQAFQDEVVLLLKEQIIGRQPELLPSEYIRQITAKHPGLIIVHDAIESCDQVSKARFPWVISAINALLEIISTNGAIGDYELFFAQRGLTHAQTGGLVINFEIFLKGKLIQTIKSSMHLKKGDKTTRQSAARLYYHVLSHQQQLYVFLLYIGPHPDRDLNRTHHLD